MLVHQAQVGMKVVFGRGNGEKTLGEIVKVNPSKAKVKTLESRGNGRGSEVGSVWTVPYSLMTPAGVAFIDEFLAMPPVMSVPDQPVKTVTHADACIMEAILDCYIRLSPEWLTADGERPMNEVRRLKNDLETRLSGLFKALGRPVGESAAYKWKEEREKQTA
jgi:hypothetical protein